MKYFSISQCEAANCNKTGASFQSWRYKLHCVLLCCGETENCENSASVEREPLKRTELSCDIQIHIVQWHFIRLTEGDIGWISTYQKYRENKKNVSFKCTVENLRNSNVLMCYVCWKWPIDKRWLFPSFLSSNAKVDIFLFSYLTVVSQPQTHFKIFLTENFIT